MNALRLLLSPSVPDGSSVLECLRTASKDDADGNPLPPLSAGSAPPVRAQVFLARAVCLWSALPPLPLPLPLLPLPLPLPLPPPPPLLLPR